MTPSGLASRFLSAAAIAAVLQAACVRVLAMQATVERTVVDGGGCQLSPGTYESQGYIVRQVEVRGAFDLFAHAAAQS